MELKTISDSKKEFHQCFPYVIAPIYRRITDELLVELHLLKHQKEFKLTNVFSVGLTTVFQDFMKGYRPEEHKKMLFDALCKSNSIDSNEMRRNAERTQKDFSNIELEEIDAFFDNKETSQNELLRKGFENFKKTDAPYSRLSVIGLYTLLKGLKSSPEDNQLKEKLKSITESIGFNIPRVERDLASYQNNIGKMKQALDLMKESIERENKKKKERESL